MCCAVLCSAWHLYVLTIWAQAPVTIQPANPAAAVDAAAATPGVFKLTTRDPGMMFSMLMLHRHLATRDDKIWYKHLVSLPSNKLRTVPRQAPSKLKRFPGKASSMLAHSCTTCIYPATIPLCIPACLCLCLPVVRDATFTTGHDGFQQHCVTDSPCITTPVGCSHFINC